MVATVEPRVEIDDRIRENPQLLKAVTDATAFLGRSVSGVEYPAVLCWRLAPLDPNTIELTMSDLPDLSDFVARRTFPVTDLTDTYFRESGMLRAWGNLLQVRSDKHKARVDQSIKNLNHILNDQSEDNPEARD